MRPYGGGSRLLIDAMHFDPPVLTRHTHTIVARFHVSDTCSQSVQDALIYAAGVPYNQVNTPPESSTDATGWATLVFHMQPGYPVSRSQQLLAMFVRARKGTSTRSTLMLPPAVNDAVVVVAESVRRYPFRDTFAVIRCRSSDVRSEHV